MINTLRTSDWLNVFRIDKVQTAQRVESLEILAADCSCNDAQGISPPLWLAYHGSDFRSASN
jgi:hypothetical protein